MENNFQIASSKLKETKLPSKHHMVAFKKYQKFSLQGHKHILYLNRKIEIVFFKKYIYSIIIRHYLEILEPKQTWLTTIRSKNIRLLKISCCKLTVTVNIFMKKFLAFTSFTTKFMFPTKKPLCSNE